MATFVLFYFFFVLRHYTPFRTLAFITFLLNSFWSMAILCHFLIPIILNSSSTSSVFPSRGLSVFVVTSTLAGTICFAALSFLSFKDVHNISIWAMVAKLQYLSLLLYPVSPHLCAGSSVGIATELRAGRSGIESRWGRDFPLVQTGPGAHPTSCTMGTGSFPVVKCGRGVLLTTHPLLVPRSWKSTAIPLPTLWATPGL